MRFTSFLVVTSLACASSAASPVEALAAPPTARTLSIDAAQWRVIPRESGHDNYYTVVTDGALPPFIRSSYHPPEATAVLGFQIPDAIRPQAQVLRWQWRALALPRGGNECEKGMGDSAAVVYVTWRRALKWYTIKYVWSSVGPRGQTCDRRWSPFSAQDTVVLESGAPINAWRSEEIYLRAEFRRHFADGNPSADVPDLIGIGLMSDGDQTKSDSSADYALFVVGW